MELLIVGTCDRCQEEAKVSDAKEALSPEAAPDEFTKDNPIEGIYGRGIEILAEGSCNHLLQNSAWSNDCDPPTVLFACDNNCENARSLGCDDNDNWMAIPGPMYDADPDGLCGKNYWIYAIETGKVALGYVRDRSITRDQYEVSNGILATLGLPPDASFDGYVFDDPSFIRQLQD
ncbi:hypothetical protein [Baaleninema simplex]|uniref:hypothetical protein n=1 Tax=Baaleninema simplex TaxID=2862350 RepID=UPI0003792105|nr:hypothetical protein [Baaleninema simplex]